MISAYCVFGVGDGKRVHFWEDGWCCSTPLYSTLPSLYNFRALKGGGLLIFGAKMGSYEAGIRGLQDPLMIGRWKRYVVSHLPYRIRGSFSMRRMK